MEYCNWAASDSVLGAEQFNYRTPYQPEICTTVVLMFLSRDWQSRGKDNDSYFMVQLRNSKWWTLWQKLEHFGLQVIIHFHKQAFQNTTQVLTALQNDCKLLSWFYQNLHKQIKIQSLLHSQGSRITGRCRKKKSCSNHMISWQISSAQRAFLDRDAVKQKYNNSSPCTKRLLHQTSSGSPQYLWDWTHHFLVGDGL